MTEEQGRDLTSRLIDTRHKLFFSNSFLEQMSRSVRGPLYSIIEFSKIAKESANDEFALNHYLDQINLSGLLMKESLDDVMALRQIAMKIVSLHPEYINLEEFLKLLNQEMDILFRATGKKLVIEKNELADCYIIADYSVLYQVLRKMIRIISQMMPNNSTVTLEVNKEELINQTITISFKVSGKEAFLSSSQIQSLKDEYEALEYDMYGALDSMDPVIVIIRCYAHAMGTDKVVVKTDSNEGTSLQISLKFNMISKEEYALETGRDFDFTSKRILVADDDEINLEIVEKLLREKGAEVITVRDGREALLTYRTEHGKFDLIMLDIVMPDIDGLSVARQIRENTTIPSSRNVPIIAMTVNAFHENYEQSLRAGMNSHLVKPIDSDRLYKTLAEFI